MRISFLLDHAYGVGGAIRATISTANALAGIGHDVRILSVKRLNDSPAFDIDPRVRLEAIVDLRDLNELSEAERELYDKPASVMPKSESIFKAYNALLESRVKATLSALDTDVVIGTRMGLNTYIARFAPKTLTRIGMAHTTFSYYNAPSLADELAALSKLDAMITVATGDVEVWRKHLAHAGTRVTGISNCVAPLGLQPSSRNSKTIMAVGRLVGVKQFHLLIRAFAIVAAKHPDWKLRVYGRGAAQQGLRDLIFNLGLHNQAFLMGSVTPIEPEWAKASIAAVTSRLESFHIGLVEAQQVGVPVVSMACERGPVDILTHESDGLLTPPNDVEAFADGLLRVIEDRELAQSLAAKGLRTASRFYPEAIAKQYQKFLGKLVSGKGGRGTGGGWFRNGRRDVPAPVARPDVVDCYVPDDTGILEIRIPDRKLKQLVLSPQGKGKSLRLDCKAGIVRVPVTTALVEGTYEVKLPGPEGEEVPARAGLLDLRGLNTRTDVDAFRLAHIVPYPDKNGNLILRSWRRAVHAEAGNVNLTDEGIDITGRMHGRYAGDCRLLALASCRQEPDAAFSVDATLAPNGDFTFTLPAAKLAHPAKDPQARLWNLSVELRNDTEPTPKPVRLTRVLDDLGARKKVFVYPSLRLADPCGSTLTPYYTDHNGLSVRVEAANPVPPIPNLCGH